MKKKKKHAVKQDRRKVGAPDLNLPLQREGVSTSRQAMEESAAWLGSQFWSPMEVMRPVENQGEGGEEGGSQRERRHSSQRTTVGSQRRTQSHLSGSKLAPSEECVCVCTCVFVHAALCLREF